MDPTNRLRIATRIHFALLRHFGEDVAVSTLLAGGADAREALWVCAASGADELVALGSQLEAANLAEPRPALARRAAAAAPPMAPKAAAPQDLAWARDSSGFGVSRLPTFLEPSPTMGSWLKPSNWLRRVAA